VLVVVVGEFVAVVVGVAESESDVHAVIRTSRAAAAGADARPIVLPNSRAIDA